MAKKGPRIPVHSTLTNDEINRLVDQAYEEGVAKGSQEFRIKINNFLQERYMKKDVHRGTPQAEAILQIARELNQAINEGTL